MMTSSRIPQSLQNVFVASQAGEDVDMISPPEGDVCSRTYGYSNTGGYALQKSRPSSLVIKVMNRAERVGVTAADATKVLLRQKRASQRFVKQETAAPQTFLDEELASRGYSTVRYSTLEGGYHSRPNPLQLASFGNCLNQAIRTSDIKLVNQLLYCGLSPNACNRFGESIVHSVCRRGDVGVLGSLLAGGCSLQISDDYGRTPLHDACWQSDNPCFDVVRRILQVDKNLIFMKDIRGATPLSYVKKENHAQWIDFLMTAMDDFWPANGADGSQPPLTQQRPNTHQLPSQITNLSCEVISLIAVGQLPPNNERLLAALVHMTPSNSGGSNKNETDNAALEDTQMRDSSSENSETTSESNYDDDIEDDDDDSEGSYDSDYSYDSDEDFEFEDGDISDIMMMASCSP